MRSFCALLFLALWLQAGPASAQPRGLSYGVAPVGNRLFWDDDAGLSDGFMWGGALSVGFGRTLTLEGTYLVGRNLETDFADFFDQHTTGGAPDLLARSVNARRYGGRLRFSLGRGGLAPYLSAGGGVLRLDPDGLDASRRLYATVGAGLELSASPRYALTVGGQLLSYRYNPMDLLSEEDFAALDEAPSRFSTQTTYNPSLRAALSIYLGGRTRSKRTAFDRALKRTFRGGARAFLSPFYGEIAFDEALAFPDHQTVVGARAGIRVGPYAQLSGFYARGAERASLLEGEVPSTFEDIQFYGGELGLRLERALGRGIVPYLSLGGGYADVLAGYAGRPDAPPPDDHVFGLGGGGVEVPLFSALHLTGDARALVSSGSDLNNLKTTSDLHTSLFYSVGVTLALDRKQRAPDVTPRNTPASAARAEASISDSASSADTKTSTAESDEALVPTNVSDKTITLPVPENGELYLRFGKVDSSVFRPAPARRASPTAVGPSAATPSPQELRAMVRETVRDVMSKQSAGATLSAKQMRQITREVLRDQIRQMNDDQRASWRTQLLRERIERLEEQLQKDHSSVSPSLDEKNEEDKRLLVNEPAERGPRLLGQPLAATWPYTGLRFGEGPTQIALGLRGDYRARNGWFRLLPEAALGFGGGTSITALLNAAAPLPYTRRYVTPYAPYVGLGLGLNSKDGLSGLEPGLNLLLGAEYPFRYGSAFVEVNTFGLFDTTRIMTGYRLSF